MAAPVTFQRVDPDNEQALAAWYSVLHASDVERWPDVSGWTMSEVRAMATRRGAFENPLLVAERDGATLGIALVQLTNEENQHRAMVDVRVAPEYRRQGIGRALVDEVAHLAQVTGRTTLCCITEAPIRDGFVDTATPFAIDLGFEATQPSNRRHLTLPPDPARWDAVRAEVVTAGDDYEVLTFTSPWPAEFIDDECELYRRMSTDAPSGDAQQGEEAWTPDRVLEMDQWLAEQGVAKLVAVARHRDSGRLVAFSELGLPGDHPGEAWQWATLVVREHRGHRLGLALKLANLDTLAAARPTARLVTTSNAARNGPMIAVNDVLGFEIVASEMVWIKEMRRP
jgi:GNAT superfamily N-acetyltransferase